MPIIFRQGALIFFFYSNEGRPREPKHVHVRASGKEAKVWLRPGISLADNRGFNSKELKDIIQLIEGRRQAFEDAWDEHFSN